MNDRAKLFGELVDAAARMTEVIKVAKQIARDEIGSNNSVDVEVTQVLTAILAAAIYLKLS